MSDDPQILADSLREEAINTAAIHEEAQAKARSADIKAAISDALQGMTRGDDNYRKRELDEKFDDIKGSLDRIEHQTVATNGKVADLVRWKYLLIGFCSCISIIILPLVFSLIQAGKLF